MSRTLPVDLTTCDREPIHIPGAVQPHGVLLAVREPSLEVVQSSASVAQHLGVPMERVLGRTLDQLLGEAAASEIRATALDTGERASLQLTIDAAGRPASFDATLHRSDELLLLELEPALEGSRLGMDRFGSVMYSIVEQLGHAEGLMELAQLMAAEMRTVTGFDRVWVYRFHPDWHGEIIGEAKRDDIETWLGMHYPASDIPAQARALFLQNWVRAIPDVHFVPSPLEPLYNPLTDRPLDLGNSLLRSVSPIHIQYLKNMGVTASLVFSLIHQGRLWGLISGHHYSGPKRVAAEVRTLCQFLAHALSLQIGTADKLEERNYALKVRSAQSGLIAQFTDDEAIEQTVAVGPITLLDVIAADGAALVRDRQVVRVGAAPSDEQLNALTAWLAEQHGPVFDTTRLADGYPPAQSWPEMASGLLAVRIARERPDYLLWFRGEQRQTVSWAGDPRKPVTIEPDGSERLHPRGSFALWEEEVRGSSVAWRPIEREAALDIRRALLDTLIHRAEGIARHNRELQAMNDQLEQATIELQALTEELLEQRGERERWLEEERLIREEAEKANKAKSDFLAMMSHELRTPLNAIGGYAQLLSMGARGPISADQASDLERIEINQKHLLGLINNLLNFAKVEAGHLDFSMANVPLRDVFQELDALIGPQMKAKSLTLSTADVPADVAVHADAPKLRQVLLNLLTNALKFTPAGGSVSVTWSSDAGNIHIHVRDTGRGISKENLAAIFEPFVQVDRHITPKADQGVGLGLAISQHLARGMGGDLVAESVVGEGSTFTLMLRKAAATG